MYRENEKSFYAFGVSMAIAVSTLRCLMGNRPFLGL